MHYFRHNRGFHRLFVLMIKKYKGLGRVGGSVTLKNPTDQEREALSLFLGRDLTGRMSVTVSLDAFTEALSRTKYSSIGFNELLDEYVGRDVLTKEEEQEVYRSRKALFFRELTSKHDSEFGHLWLEHIQSSGLGTRGIHLAFDKHPAVLFVQLENVLIALERLSQTRQAGTYSMYERLPVFASKTIQDPHGFDLDTDQGRYLISALQLIRNHEDGGYGMTGRLSAEAVTELFGYFGIIRDDLLNFVTCAGLLAFRGGNEPIALWRAACDDAAVMNVPLREVTKLQTIVPATSFDDPNQPRVVYVVENSGVLSEIIDSFSGTHLPPVVCTHGQFKLACLMLLDRLVASNTIIYYSGDFDPEGLQMVSRLIQRFPGHVIPWRYTVDDYNECLTEVTLSESRLKGLDSVNHPLLASVRDRLRFVRKAGYQEGLVGSLVGDIKRNFT